MSNNDYGTGSTSNPVIGSPSGSDGQLIKWYLGATISSAGPDETYASPGQEFEYIVAAEITAPPSQGNDFDLTQNLMKFTSYNSPGVATANRNNATYDLEAPSLSVLKGVESNGSTTDSTSNT